MNINTMMPVIVFFYVHFYLKSRSIYDAGLLRYHLL
jgi:hypothetical protein